MPHWIDFDGLIAGPHIVYNKVLLIFQYVSHLWFPHDLLFLTWSLISCLTLRVFLKVSDPLVSPPVWQPQDLSMEHSTSNQHFRKAQRVSDWFIAVCGRNDSWKVIFCSLTKLKLFSGTIPSYLVRFQSNQPKVECKSFDSRISV